MKYCNILTNGRRDSRKVMFMFYNTDDTYCKTLILRFLLSRSLLLGSLRRMRGSTIHKRRNKTGNNMMQKKDTVIWKQNGGHTFT